MNISTELIPVIISISIFFSILLLFWGIFQLVKYFQLKRAIIEKIKYSGGKTETFEEDYPSFQIEEGFRNRVLSLLGLVGKRISRKKPKEYSQMRVNFLRAGIRWRNAPAVFWGIKSFLTVLLPLCFIFVRVLFSGFLSTAGTLLILVFLSLAGFCLPDIWLRFRISMRKKLIIKGLPDALDLLVVCVEAGMGLDSSINHVAKEIKLENKVLSDEFNLYILELQAGKSRQEALKNLAIRADLESVNNFVTLLIQSDKLGISLAQTLRVYSDTFRKERYWKAEELAGKLGVKLTVILVLFIFPSLIVVIVGPAVIHIYKMLILQ